LVSIAANLNEATQGHALHGAMHAYGDRDYTGMTKRDENQASTVPWHVPMKPGERRVLPDAPLGQLLETIEKAKASIRAQVEPAFHVLMDL
jgi:IS5 family transposase